MELCTLTETEIYQYVTIFRKPAFKFEVSKVTDVSSNKASIWREIDANNIFKNNGISSTVPNIEINNSCS